MVARPRAVAFDIIGTVFSQEPLRPALVELGLPAHTLELWYAQTLRDGFALTATGDFQSFRDVARGTLEGLLAWNNQPIDRKRIASVLDKFAELPAHADAKQAFARLQQAGVRASALTNGSEANTRALFQKAGLLDAVERIISIDDVRMWKPRTEVYQAAVRTLGVPAGRLALVAAHAWDCYGAHQAGLVTGWVSRQEKYFSPALGQPDVQSDSLVGVVDALLQLATSE